MSSKTNKTSVFIDLTVKISTIFHCCSFYLEKLSLNKCKLKKLKTKKAIEFI